MLFSIYTTPYLLGLKSESYVFFVSCLKNVRDELVFMIEKSELAKLIIIDERILQALTKIRQMWI
jgi:hypothetical protein